MDNATAMDDNVINMDDPSIMSMLQHKKRPDGQEDARSRRTSAFARLG
jgi:hypothetical protein